MKNWARNVQFSPEIIEYPSSIEEIQACVLRAANSRKKIRIIGTGHSFNKLCTTTHILLSLDRYQGLVSVDKEKCIAVVKGGTKLKQVSKLLSMHGMAMENMGDIDAQSIAGTISTGTHGTGLDFGTISTQVLQLKFINGSGELITCSETENKDIFKAAQVSLGTLGVIAEVTLKCVPSYRLAIQHRSESMARIVEQIEHRNTENRNFEYYWIPYTDVAWTKTSNIVTDEADKVSLYHYFMEYVVENLAFKCLCEYAYRFPSQNRQVARWIGSLVTDVRKVTTSHEIYATQRLVRFTEMEYNIPADAYDDVWTDLTKLVNSGKYNIHFPIENRWVKKDDIYMSPAYGRDSAYIACHAYNKKDSKAYFEALEHIFVAHGGRPHWGKGHNLKAEQIEKMYPKFTVFKNQQKLHDPDRIFVNPYLEKVLGI